MNSDAEIQAAWNWARDQGAEEFILVHAESEEEIRTQREQRRAEQKAIGHGRRRRRREQAS